MNKEVSRFVSLSAFYFCKFQNIIEIKCTVEINYTAIPFTKKDKKISRVTFLLGNHKEVKNIIVKHIIC